MNGEKVRIRCGTNDCGISFEVEKESILHDRYIQCPFCGWQADNPYFEGEIALQTHVSMDEFKHKIEEGQRAFKTNPESEARGLILKCRESGMTYGGMEFECNWRLNKSQIWQIEKGKWWPSKQNRAEEIVMILKKIWENQEKKLTGLTNNSTTKVEND